jgi:hypothetical protein
MDAAPTHITVQLRKPVDAEAGKEDSRTDWFQT